jgi:hypothetical protein
MEITKKTDKKGKWKQKETPENHRQGKWREERDIAEKFKSMIFWGQMSLETLTNWK